MNLPQSVALHISMIEVTLAATITLPPRFFHLPPTRAFVCGFFQSVLARQARSKDGTREPYCTISELSRFVRYTSICRTAPELPIYSIVPDTLGIHGINSSRNERVLLAPLRATPSSCAFEFAVPATMTLDLLDLSFLVPLKQLRLLSTSCFASSTTFGSGPLLSGTSMVTVRRAPSPPTLFARAARPTGCLRVRDLLDPSPSVLAL